MFAGAVAAVVLTLPGAALAWHAKQSYAPGVDPPSLQFLNWDAVNAANPTAPQLVCTSCHTLNDLEGDQDTAHLIASSRNLNSIRAANGGTTPASLGCVYCHNTDINNKMHGVLSHFQSTGSKHPVGRNFVTGAETDREYLSGYLTTSTTELECLDCHDVSLVVPVPGAQGNGYVNHADSDDAVPLPANNPYMLKNVTVAGEYDNFCRTCHGSTQAANYKGSGKDIRLGVTVTVGGVPIPRHGDASTAQIVEDDGTQLRTTVAAGGDQCRRCHDTHYSGKSVLYNDGHEKHKEGGVEVADTAIVSLGDTSCTEVCHFPGDDDNYVNASNNNYVNHGHGKANSTYEYVGVDINFASGTTVTMGMNCTSCHNAIDTSDVSGTRRRHVTAPTAGTTQKNYKDRFNLDNIPVQATDTGSVYGNPLNGICFQCHSSYERHKTKTAGLEVGCQDCHDEHGEGSGAGSNVFMIPLTGKPAGTYVTPTRAKPGVESIVYDTPRINPTTGNVDLNAQDFFNGATVTGLCDSTECHGLPTSAKGYAPAAAFLAGGSHTGGIITTAGYDCANACHTHKGDSNGAWRAVDSCASNTAGCHGQTDTTVQPNGTIFPDRAGKHAEHIDRIVALNAGTSTSDTTTCNWCHPNGAHSGNATTPAELMDGATYHFKDIKGVVDSGDTVTIGTSCNNVNCHYNTQVTIADWYGSPAVTCTYCHQTDGTYNAGSNPLPNAHTKHVDEVVDGGYNYACTNCHVDNGADMAHQNGTLAGDVLFTVTAPPWGNDADEVVGGTGTGAVKYGTGTAANYYTCAGVSCHGDFSGGNTANTPNWYNTVAAVGAAAADGRCGTCHGTTVGTDPLPIYADGAKGNKHPIHHTTEGYGCQVCHYPTTTNGTSVTAIANHVNGAYNVDDDGIVPTLDSFTYTGTANGTCTLSECHGGSSVNWNRAATPDFTCDACHATTGGLKTGVTDDPDYTRNGTKISKINDQPGGEFATYGHGSANGGSKSCASCHDSTVPHDTTAGLTGGVNPFRLLDLTPGGALNFSCNYNSAACHTTGLATNSLGFTYDQITTHSAPAMIGLTPSYDPKYDGAAGGWGFAPDCINCHDPHGDGTNLQMLQREMFDKAAFNVPTQAPPALPSEQLGLVFTNNAAGVGNNSFAWTTTMAPNYSGVCQECHEGTAGVSTTHSFVDDVSADTASHTTTSDCSACHKHNAAFIPSGCSSASASCHGDGTNAYWPLDAGSLSTQWPRRNGRHQVHMDQLGQRFYAKAASALSGDEQKYICDICHNGPDLDPGASGHNDALQPANVGNFLRMWSATPPTLPAADGGTAATYTAATYTGSTFNNGTAVCNNVDCHNEKATANPYEWYGAGTTSCLVCHTKGGTSTATVAHPASGLHNLMATNTTAHDDAFPGGVCTTCHTVAGQAAHIDGVSVAGGDFTAAQVYLNSGTAAGQIGTYVEGGTAPLRGTCASTTSMLGTCHSDGGRWARQWTTDADADHRTNTAPTALVCRVCHGTLSNWAAGMTVNHSSTKTAKIDDGTHGGCAQCHVLPTAPYIWGTHHDMLETGVRYVETNNNPATGYNNAAGNCVNACHGSGVGDNAAHTLGGSTIWADKGLLGLGAECTACHNGTTSQGAAGSIGLLQNGVNPVMHMNTSRGNIAGSCDDCHPGNRAGTSTHKRGGNANVVAIPNFLGISSGIGINYGHTVSNTVDGDPSTFKGFVLGGDLTTGQTEAEICWNCHTAAGTPVPNGNQPSEWGTNTNTNGGLSDYNFGSLSTANWTTATWSSANFTYKSGLLSTKPYIGGVQANKVKPINNPGTGSRNTGSTHSANNAAGVVGLDNVANIRCSYCHKVHTGTAGDNSTVGPPLLRGTWKGNPYREDGAPRTGASYTGRGNYGLVPRGNVLATELGGYQIDQNNNSPASNWVIGTPTGAGANDMAGLCTSCHGTSLAGLDTDGSANSDWVAGQNSHNVVINGATGTPFNLFGGARRHPSAAPYPTAANQANSSFRTAPWMSYKHLATGSGGYGFRGTPGYSMTPNEIGSRGYAHRGYNWGATIDYTTAQPLGYHQFSCSKCHTPHASRLPRLLITNCLDTKVNTWEDGFTKTPASTYTAENQSVRTSNLTSAQNCHRRRDPSFAVPAWTNGPAINTDGWNNVSPW